MPFVAKSTGEENANLYKRGVNEGSHGELLDASELLELPEVFGEDGELTAVPPTRQRPRVSRGRIEV